MGVGRQDELCERDEGELVGVGGDVGVNSRCGHARRTRTAETLLHSEMCFPSETLMKHTLQHAEEDTLAPV